MAEVTQTVTIRVRYFAGAKAAAGVTEESLVMQHGSTLGDVLTTLSARHGATLERVFTAASYLVDGVAVRDKSASITHGIELDVLPPFAGG